MNLRRLTVEDADAILAMEADPEVMQHSTGVIAPTPARRAQLIAYIESDQGAGGHWAITSERQTVGWISLTELGDTGRIQIAYRLSRANWGKGLAAAAVQEVFTYAKHALQLSELVAVV